MILTKNMVRDYLIFNNPCTLTELVNNISNNTKLDIDKKKVLEHLKALEADNVIEFDNNLGFYYIK